MTTSGQHQDVCPESQPAPPCALPLTCGRAPPRPSTRAGSLPHQWCEGGWWQFDVQGNAGAPPATCLPPLLMCLIGGLARPGARSAPSSPLYIRHMHTVTCAAGCLPTPAGLCDEVPSCLRDRITSFAGTSLIDNINDQDSGTGGGWGGGWMAAMGWVGRVFLGVPWGEGQSKGALGAFAHALRWRRCSTV